MLYRFIIVLIVLGCWNIATYQSDFFKPSDSTVSANPTYQWRYTAKGWKQIPVVSEDHSIRAPQAEPTIHPFLWTTLKLLLLAAAIAWASSEWEWSQMVNIFKRKSAKQKYQQPVPGIEGIDE